MNRIFLALIVMASLLGHAQAAGKPLKVYILAGQSNMEGHAKVETFDYIGDDPATAPMLKEMRGPDGKPRVCERVWISYLTGSPDRGTLGEGFGKLTAGYGSRGDPKEDGGKIGPEFTFGIAMQKAYDGPILIIKTAWGGKSLNMHFRPPSAGTYEFNEFQKKFYAESGQIEKRQAVIDSQCHKYYRLMIDHVKKVLADPKQVCPDYDPQAGYEVAGFAWFQGWNDMCDSHTYPNRREPGGYDLYSELLAHFIRDVRKDLGAPEMPFVIGVMGVGGIQEEPNYFRQGMAKPAAMPEFKGNVMAVETAPYWDQPLSDLADEMGTVNKAAYYLRKGEPFHVRKDPIGNSLLDKYLDEGETTMTNEQIKAFMAEYRAKRITPEKEAMWKRGASNAGYHYLGCAKTFALIGKAFAEANLEMEKR
jgi:hypothetical protein